MNRFQSQIFFGVLIGLTGMFLIALSYNPSRAIQYGVAAGMFLSSFFAFTAANKSKGSEVPFKYSWLLGAGMFVYALAILIYGSTFERFITITIAFMLFFGIAEIIFGFGLMAFKKYISLPIIVMKMLLGLLMAIGAVLILGMAFVDKSTSLVITGVLILLSGFNFILLANTIRKNVLPEKVA